MSKRLLDPLTPKAPANQDVSSILCLICFEEIKITQTKKYEFFHNLCFPL